MGHIGWLANPLMLLSTMPVKRSLKLAFAALAIPVAASSITLTGFLVLDVKLLVDGTAIARGTFEAGTPGRCFQPA
ncbi:hypothetical protein JJB99_23315 [Bradyrhizobium diazoefficiens]|uniref:hypothetical protein n=1 Tax=Bradyrhizobium diazoefficiens TaxID=1355477 RepID=UPI0019097C5C|nr:hypothetical protein [Bradyrhizobium diazoefficiens]QQO12403.1 hypothetical protein JJB99_23315 [Bradyrhizobium diazoefficiens]